MGPTTMGPTTMGPTTMGPFSGVNLVLNGGGEVMGPGLKTGGVVGPNSTK